MVEALLSMLTVYKKSCAFFAAIKLGLFDELAKGKCTLHELANKITVDPEVLNLLLIYFKSEGIVGCPEGKWCIGKEFTLIDKKLADLIDVIAHEENIYKNWVTPDVIVSSIKEGVGRRTFDQQGLQPESLHIYNKAMYGKNVSIISFWIRREIRKLGNISLLEYGRSPGVISTTLIKQGLRIDAAVTVCDEFYNIAKEIASKSEISVYRIDEFISKEKYDVITLFNTVHYYSKVDLIELLKNLRTRLKPDATLCIIDLFYCEDNQFMHNLLLDWITHGGIHSLFIDEVTEILNESGFTNIRVKELKDIGIDMIFCSAEQLEERG